MKDQSEKIVLVVGLGNPGSEYAASRHNVGFMTVAKLLGSLPGSFTESHVADSRLFAGRFRGGSLYLQLPLTYMNESGRAVAGICRKLKLAPEEVLVISDDLDLPVGALRLRCGGSDGGHNGLKSIIAELGGAGFKRLRIGIGRPRPGECIDYVLSGFDASEQPAMETAIADAAEAVKLVLSRGMGPAMNKFSGRARTVRAETEDGQQPHEECGKTI